MKVKSNISPISKLPNLNTLDEVIKFLEKPTIAISEFLTGLLAGHDAWWSQHVLSAGRIVQASVKRRLLTQLGSEIQKYRESGRIKEDYYATAKTQTVLLELLKFIDSDIPDQEVFNAAKSIFLSGVSADADEKEEEVAYQLLLICKQLNSMDLQILKVCYRIYKGIDLEGVNTGTTSFGDWQNTVAVKIGYGLPELVAMRDDRLVELGLLSPRSYSDRSGIRAGKEFRLTSLSIKLCERIMNWNA